ncbi:MAG: tRNA uridine-5-carboxymethylaminomethyl(34) synthesis GTPase MnmE [Pseudomonadota bacterium]
MEKQRTTLDTKSRLPVVAETIAAIATPAGRGGVGVIRVSGHALQAFAQALSGKIPRPRLATLVDFKAADQASIDRGLLLYFPAPHSFTGEDVLEIQAHGGALLMQLLLARCLDLGARLAEPGEFSRRAYVNGKLDLAQAEAVVDLIDAATVAAARAAIRSLQGVFSKEIHAFVAQLIELRALLEATLDFPEEEIDFLEAAKVFPRLDSLRERLSHVLARAQQGSRLRSGLNVVLVGQPNVGKSSLLNCLAGDALAIVTPFAGTTRDVVRAHLQLEGIPLNVIDTAGLRETDDAVERLGIERTWREIEAADALVLLLDAHAGSPRPESAILDKFPQHLPRITVHNKIDLLEMSAQCCKKEGAHDEVEIFLSAMTGDGLDLLRQELLRIAGWDSSAEDVFVARERHLRALRKAQAHLLSARLQLPQLELFAEELRLAQLALSTITGEFSSDDLLGEIFSRFCIGK